MLENTNANMKHAVEGNSSSVRSGVHPRGKKESFQ